MDAHSIVAAESLAAIRTFSCSVGEAILDAVVAEEMATCFDAGVLDPTLAYLALQHRLHKCHIRTLFAFAFLLPDLNLLLQTVDLSSETIALGAGFTLGMSRSKIGSVLRLHDLLEFGDLADVSFRGYRILIDLLLELAMLCGEVVHLRPHFRRLFFELVNQ